MRRNKNARKHDVTEKQGAADEVVSAPFGFIKSIFKNIVFNNFRLKLVGLVCITLIPLTILQIINIESGYEASVDSQIETSEELASAISATFMTYLQNVWSTQKALGLAIDSNPDWNENDIVRYMNKVMESDVDVSCFIWLSPVGDVIASTNPSFNLKGNVEGKYIERVVNGEEKVVSNLHWDDKSQMFVFAATGIRVDGRLVGIVTSIIREDEIKSVFTAKMLGATSSYGLIDAEGTIIYRNGAPELTYDNRKISSDSPAWQALRGEIARVQTYKASVDGSTLMGVNYPIEPIGWACFVTNSVSEKIKPYLSRLYKNLSILFVVFVTSHTILVS